MPVPAMPEGVQAALPAPAAAEPEQQLNGFGEVMTEAEQTKEKVRVRPRRRALAAALSPGLFTDPTPRHCSAQRASAPPPPFCVAGC